MFCQVQNILHIILYSKKRYRAIPYLRPAQKQSKKTEPEKTKTMRAAQKRNAFKRKQRTLTETARGMTRGMARGTARGMARGMSRKNGVCGSADAVKDG